MTMKNTSSLSMPNAAAAPWMTELPVFDMAAIQPEPTTTPSMLSTTSISTVTVQNTQGDCAPQPAGYGPVPKHDTMWGFYDSSEIRDAALNATVPLGYAQSFRLQIGSYVGAHYLGHYELQSYDTLECANRCDGHDQRAHQTSNMTADRPGHRVSTQPTAMAIDSAEGEDEKHVCQGFNIYFERSPSIYLSPRCHDSMSRTVIKCALWGEPLPVMGATNTGYREWDFDVVIAGSNGYSLEKYADMATETRNMGRGNKVSNTLLVALAAIRLVVLGFMTL